MPLKSLASAPLLALALAGTAAAQVPTDRGPLRLVVGFPVGGSADVLARTIADKLKAELGVTVVVDNRAGAGGAIAADYVKAQPADGLTVLLGTTHMMVMAPLTMKSVRYDGIRDFRPVLRMSSFHEGIAIPTTSPAKNLKEWLDLARRNPQHASYGVPAPGSLPQFIGYRLGELTRTPLLAVPYKGTAPLTQDLLGGQIAAGILPIADLAQYQNQRVRILAVNGTQRASRLPDVPTLKELGYPEFDRLEWTGLFVPRTTSDATLQHLSAAAARVAVLPQVRDALEKLGTVPDPSPGDSMTRAIEEDRTLWGPIIKASGFSAE